MDTTQTERRFQRSLARVIEYCDKRRFNDVRKAYMVRKVFVKYEPYLKKSAIEANRIRQREQARRDLDAAIMQLNSMIQEPGYAKIN